MVASSEVACTLSPDANAMDFIVLKVFLKLLQHWYLINMKPPDL
ncbi:hypothetical protein H1R20_g11405, partial [Candolleomyces eurysporus]